MGGLHETESRGMSGGGTCSGGSGEPGRAGLLERKQPWDRHADAGYDATMWNPSSGAGRRRGAPRPRGFPAVLCAPSDEQAQGCFGRIDSGCTYSPLCGDITTCEPFIKNPEPGAGTGTFRMRLVNITAPPVFLNCPDLKLEFPP